MKLHSSPYPWYKESSMEWVDQLPADWAEKRVKDLFRLVTDLAPKGNNFELLSLYASIGVRPRKDMEQRGNKSVTTEDYWIVKKGDIIVNKLLAWMGAIGLSEYDGVTSPAYDILRRKRRHNRDIDERYYAYLFRTERAQEIFRRHSRGIMDVRLRLYFDRFGAITVPVPAFPVQQAIADYLDAKTAQIDRRVDLLSEKAHRYRDLKHSLINDATTRGLEKTVPMKDSGVQWIGQIPAHWEMKRLKEVADIQNSNVDKKSNGHELPIRLCNYLDVYTNEFIRSSMNFMPATADESEIRRFRIKKNDVLITKDSESFDDIAVPSLSMETIEDVICGYHLAQIRAKEKVLFGPYLFRLFQSKKYGFRFVINAKGITRFGLGQSAIADTLTPIPPLTEQKAIADYLDAKTAHIEKIVETINAEIETLKELRKTLINDVVTGKVKVYEA